MAKLPSDTRARLDRAAAELRSRLGDNLHALVLYGSAVRGDFVPVASDVNLLIVLEDSTAAAHMAIAEAVAGRLRIDPMIIGRPGMERSFQAFALKFLSMARNYEVLHGADPFRGFAVAPEVERFLCEQALRNIRLRLVRGYVVFGRDRVRYTRFLLHWIPTIFIDLSAALRLDGTEMPHDFSGRIDILAEGYGVDAVLLRGLLALKGNPPRPGLDFRLVWARRLPRADIERYHDGVHHLLTEAIAWMERCWPSDTSRPVDGPGGVSNP